MKIEREYYSNTRNYVWDMTCCAQGYQDKRGCLVKVLLAVGLFIPDDKYGLNVSLQLPITQELAIY